MINTGMDNQGASCPPQPVGYPTQSPAGYPPQPVYPATTTQTSNTTVIIQQPQTQIIVQKRQPWSTSICSCCDDISLCLLGLLCPCVLPCVVSVKAGECCCVGALWPVALRASIRERYNIQGGICGDFCAIWCFPLCAFCQMGREIDIQG